jgi:hypothetical protein
VADLVTLAEAKGFLGETTSYLDTELELLIKTATSVIRRAIDPIEYTAYEDEAYNGNGQARLQLRHWPLEDPDQTREVKIGEADVTASCKWDPQVGVLYYEAGFPGGVQNVTVSYSAGYAQTCPDDLKGACLMLVKFYAKSDLMARSVFFEGGGGMGAERAMPAQVLDILRNYPSYQGR